MRNPVSFRALVLLSTLSGVALGGPFSRQEKPASFSKQAVGAVDQRRWELEGEVRRITNEVNQLAKQKGSEFKSRALQEAESQKQYIEQEIQRLSQEAEQMARDRASAAETTAREKLTELEQVATGEVQKIAEAAETLTREKMAEAERAAKERLANLEKAVTTGVTSYVDRVVFGKFTKEPQKLLPASQSDTIMQILQSLVLCSSVGNFLGPAPVLDLWNAQGFGDEFFPFHLSVNKRILAATMEACGFVLLLQSRAKQQLAGIILVALMFGWGCMLNVKRGLWLTVFPGVVASLATTLLINELVPVKPAKVERANKIWNVKRGVWLAVIPGAIAATMLINELVPNRPAKGNADEKKKRR